MWGLETEKSGLKARYMDNKREGVKKKKNTERERELYSYVD